MSLAGPNRKPALTAAASKIAFSRITADKLKEEDWQVRAWGVYDKLPSVFYMTRYRSDIASKIEYFVGTVEDPSQDPEADDGAGAKVLDAEGGPDLLRRIVSEFVVHWDIPGEGYLTRFDDAPFWRVLSTQELKKQGQGVFMWGDAETDLGSIDSDNVYRVWDSHPRFHWQADSPVRHILEEAEELILLSRAAKVQSMSQVSAGVLILPDSIDLSPFAEDEEGTEDDVARWLIQVLAKPVSDPGSTASITPAVMTMHGDDIAKVRHLTFDRDWQVNLELRRELLAAVATGLDLPPEILTGMADLNHWSAWLVSEQAVNQHVLPSVDAILDSLTQNWFRPLLEASGVDPDLYVLWRDPSPATVPPDQTDVAIKLNELGVISDEATRRVTNFDEEDAPTPEELERKAAMKPAPSEEAPRNDNDPPVRGSFGDPPLPGAAVTAAVRRRIVATELADLDAELLTWVVEESDREIERLLNLAITAADDPIDVSMLSSLATQLEAKIAQAQAAARSWLSRTLGRTPSDEGESLARSQGVQVILAGIVEAVRRKLFTPDASPDPIDLGRMPNITTPTEAIRNGLSLAGGGPAVYEDGNTSELIGNGQKVKDELAGDGFFVDGYEWKYGNPANTFEPHLNLDGVQFASWDDPRLAVGFGHSWLRRSHYRPGDHKGCQCAFVQVIIHPSGPQLPGIRPDEPTPSGPPLTWEQFGVKLPKDKARAKLMTDALQRLNGLEPGVRDRFVHLLGRFDGRVKVAVATPSTQSIRELGHVMIRTRAGEFLPDSMELRLQLSRPTVEWDDWATRHNAAHRQAIADSGGSSTRLTEEQGRLFHSQMDEWKAANPEPEHWRLATPDELADVMVHELGHANDYQHKFDGATLLRSQLPTELQDKVWDMYHGGDPNWRTTRGGGTRLSAYEYATSKPAEMVAELQKFYLRGVHGDGLDLTAIEWRAANPQLAHWVEENILP